MILRFRIMVLSTFTMISYISIVMVTFEAVVAGTATATSMMLVVVVCAMVVAMKAVVWLRLSYRLHRRHHHCRRLRQQSFS